MELDDAIKNLSEIVTLSEDNMENNKDITAILDFEDLKSLQIVLRKIKQSIL